MSRLADYFVIVGYDHEKERKFCLEFLYMRDCALFKSMCVLTFQDRVNEVERFYSAFPKKIGRILPSLRVSNG